MLWFYFFFFKQKTAYEVRISDWSSDVCSSDLAAPAPPGRRAPAIPPDQRQRHGVPDAAPVRCPAWSSGRPYRHRRQSPHRQDAAAARDRKRVVWGKRVSERIDLLGPRTFKNKKTNHI